jgi:prevent-host-death family protein
LVVIWTKQREVSARKINVAEDIVPIGEFKTHASEFVRHLHATGRPVVITQNGKPTAVVVTPAAFEELGYRELVRAKIRAGIADADAGRTRPFDVVGKRLRARMRKARASR